MASQKYILDASTELYAMSGRISELFDSVKLETRHEGESKKFYPENEACWNELLESAIWAAENLNALIKVIGAAKEAAAAKTPVSTVPMEGNHVQTINI